MESLIVKSLTKRFGKITAVDDISLNVPAGSIFAFLGPNGAGKSTSIKMFTTLLKPDKGTIMLEGIDVLREQHKARGMLAVVFQDPSLDDELTAYENLKFHAVIYDVPEGEQKKRIDDALRLVDLVERKDALVKTFSGGMKRRLEIARGLIHYPKFLFLDEPTTGLDPQTRNAIWQHIRKLNKERGMTILMTTQYMQEAEGVADLVAIIDRGRIIAQGTVKELMKKTKARNLEDTFLKLTGRDIREQGASSLDHMRVFRQVRH